MGRWFRITGLAVIILGLMVSVAGAADADYRFMHDDHEFLTIGENIPPAVSAETEEVAGPVSVVETLVGTEKREGISSLQLLYMIGGVGLLASSIIFLIMLYFLRKQREG